MARISKQTSFEELDDATCALSIGDFRRRQLNKQVITRKGTWATVCYQAQDWKEQAHAWSAPFVIVQRYIRRAGRWVRHSHINLRGGQAMACLQIVATWEAMANELAAKGIDVGEAIESAERGAAPKRKARRRKDVGPTDGEAVAQPT